MVTTDPDTDRTVTLNWDASVETSDATIFNGVDDYIIEQSINGGPYSEVSTCGYFINTTFSTFNTKHWY